MPWSTALSTKMEALYSGVVHNKVGGMSYNVCQQRLLIIACNEGI